MSSKSKQTNTSTLDPKYDALVYGNANQARDLATSLQPYGGQLTAGFNPTQSQAQAGLLDFSRGNVGAPLFAQASNAASGAASYQPMQINPEALAATDYAKYMNPYQQEVIDASLSDIHRQREIALNEAKTRALAAGAWGGTGGAVLQSGISDNYDRAGASTIAQLRNQGFANAQQAAQFDIGNSVNAQQANQGAGLTANAQRLQAAGVLAGLSDQERAQLLQNLNLQSAVGDAQQHQEQAALDAQHQAYLEWLNTQIQGQNLANSGVQLVPQMVNTTSVQKTSPGLQGILGAIGTAGSALATGGASLGLGSLGGILGGGAAAAPLTYYGAMGGVSNLYK